MGAIVLSLLGVIFAVVALTMLLYCLFSDTREIVKLVIISFIFLGFGALLMAVALRISF